MTVQCMAPDTALGVAVRLAGYLDCQSRALGENGFQAMTGGPVMTAMLSGVVTIFIALIGYRMILGSIPGIRDGISWAVRLGVVLALVTSWPAFQTLVYHVVTDGPKELAAVILPAAGLSSDGMDDRIQGAYDVIRLGSAAMVTASADTNAAQQPQAPLGSAPNPPAASLLPQAGPSTPPLPQTASLFVVSTSGLIGALRIVVGFLVAIGPIAILGLLFQGTIGVFEGWLRAIVGAAFGVLAASVTTSIELIVVESELAHARAVQLGADPASSLDPQALVTIILVFVVMALAAVYAAARLAGAFRLPLFGAASWSAQPGSAVGQAEGSNKLDRALLSANGVELVDRPARARTAAVADALAAAAYRDQETLAGRSAAEGPSRLMTIRQESGGGVAPIVPLGVAGRRSTGRRTQSARRRDIPA